MSINNKYWPPARAGANIPTEQALQEESAFTKKYPKRPTYYELPLAVCYLYLLGARQAGAVYFTLLNTLDGETVGNGHCCLTEKGRMIDVLPIVRVRYQYFREQTKNHQTAMYGFDIDFVITEFKKAFDLGYDYVRFCNGINALGLNTMNFGFCKEGSAVVEGVSSRGNDPFLCPPLCPPDEG